MGNYDNFIDFLRLLTLTADHISISANKRNDKNVTFINEDIEKSYVDTIRDSHIQLIEFVDKNDANE